MSGTPYLVGGNSGPAGTNTLVVALANSVAALDTIYLGVLVSVAGTTVSVTDSQGNAYTQILADTTEVSEQLYVFAATGVTALVAGGSDPDTITVTYSTISSVLGAVAIGDNDTIAVDKAIIAHGSGTAISTGSTGTLTESEEHAILFVCNGFAGGNPAYAVPWNANVLALQGAGTTAIISVAYQDVTANTSLTGSATIASAGWTAALVTTEVAPLTIETIPSVGVVFEPYSQTLEATGGIAPYTWAKTSGTLPPGVALSGNTISAALWPTTAGTYNFTIQVTDSAGVAVSEAMSIVVLPNVTEPAIPEWPGALVGTTWAAETNATTPALTANNELAGPAARWQNSADGTTQVQTPFQTILPGKPYVLSGYMMPMRTGLGLTIGIEWYTSGGTLISTSTNANALASYEPGQWQPLAVAFASPSNAAKCKVTANASGGFAGDLNYATLFFLAQSSAQVLIDWVNPAFGSMSVAGQDFMDVSPFVRMDQGITINTRGRQDAISEIEPGSATFSLQNDTGMFMRSKSGSIPVLIGGQILLQRRCQINLADEAGNWYTRFDGPLADINYLGDNTGNTNLATVTVSDVMAYLNRQDTLSPWTREQVLADGPLYHWALNDSGAAGGSGVAAETSGNNGPPMRLQDTDGSKVATITWSDTTGGVETLADAVAPGQLDGSEYWNPGSTQPNSPVRGLDSGTVGPFTSPMPSVYLTPVVNTVGGVNWFIGNKGYQLNASLVSNPLDAREDDYTLETWFTLDPGIKAAETTNVGPFIQLSFGSSRKASCYVAGVFLVSSAMKYGFFRYDGPPAFRGLNWPSVAPPAATAGTTIAMNADTVQIPHHLVVTVNSDPVSPTATAYLDNNLITSFSMEPDDVIDTICAGGAYGGTGCHWGNVSLLQVYPYVLSATQIAQHCQLGQYGMWETTTDDSIAQLAEYAGIPGWWNGLTGAHHGLSLTEYQDISSENPLSAMQLYEQTEQGLLFVNAAGQLVFHTRDWRMGHQAPDLLLPPDTFDASMGQELVDQFQVNEEAVSTQAFPSGASFVNTDSQDAYGAYSTSPVGSPKQLPLISWSRAPATLGLPSFSFWAEPNLEDYCAWNANVFADPWLLPGQLTVDLLTLSEADTGLAISDFYSLEIDDMIAPDGTLPASFPDESFSSEWFIEGISETISSGTPDGSTAAARTIQFYCSAAETQRAWIPADPVYGVLGSTTRLGVSQADTSTPQADGKDVSHDGGPPYWPPTFTPATAVFNDNPYFTNGDSSGWNSFQGTFTVTGSPPDPDNAPATFVAQYVNNGVTAGAMEESGDPFAVTVGQQIIVSAWVYSTAPSIAIGVDWENASHGFLSTSTTTVTVPTNTWTQIASATLTAPAGTAFSYPRVGSGSLGETIYAWAITAGPPFVMNNPAQDGHGFVGASDIRGIAANLAQAIEPPLCVASAISQVQAIGTGSSASPDVLLDTVHVDTVGGMGLVPGWPNWYVCTVPGYYEIDVNAGWGVGGVSASSALGWIVVALGGAQVVAQGTGTPRTVNQYVCPVGDQVRTETGGLHANTASTRMYLGMGDMVALAVETNNGQSLGFGQGGSHMSIRYCGLGRTDDRSQINTSLATGGSVVAPTSPVVHGNLVYTNTFSYSYWGTDHKFARRFSNTAAWQGGSSSNGEFGKASSQISQIVFDFGQIRSDMIGKTPVAMTITCRNQNGALSGQVLQPASGASCTMLLGVAFNTPGGATWHPQSATDSVSSLAQYTFKLKQTQTITLPKSFFSYVLGTTPHLMKCFKLGDDSTLATRNYGYWNADPGSWTLTISY